ncbi:aminopeptidase N [Serratia sp. PL17]|nr:aminopeptidase N [Serratia sp. PL17]
MNVGRGRTSLTREQILGAFAAAQHQHSVGLDLLMTKYRNEFKAEQRLRAAINKWVNQRPHPERAAAACQLALSMVLERKLQQVALFTAANRNRSFVNVLTEQQEAPKAVNPDKKGSMQTSFTAPVVRITDLQKQKGDEVDMQIVHKLSKRPTRGHAGLPVMEIQEAGWHYSSSTCRHNSTGLGAVTTAR